MSKTTSWWTDISGPARFIDSIVSAAGKEENAIVTIPRDVPFRQSFFDIMKNHLLREDSGRAVESIDTRETDIARFFMNNYCRKEMIASFRPKPGYTATKYLAKTEGASFHGKTFLIITKTDEELCAWSSFVTEYTKNLKKGIDPALFVILTNLQQQKDIYGIRRISYDDFVSHFDAYTYCAIRASDINEPTEIKVYLAELASSITKGNIEFAETALYTYREFLADPLSFFAKRKMSLELSQEEQLNVLWESQIKCLFPLLEKFRRYLIGKYRENIQNGLPLHNPVGDDIVNASDAELGTLLYMTKSSLLRIGHRDHKALEANSKARNDLAHLTTLSFGDISKIIRELSDIYKEEKL